MLGKFPQEIYDDIIRHLKNDRTALRATSLTCYALLPVSQKQLFLRIALYPTLTAGCPTASQFRWILTESPHIGSYVKELELHLCPNKTTWTGWSPSLDFCLRHLPHLRMLALKVDQIPPCSSGFIMRPPEDPKGAEKIMQALTHAVQLPSLVFLDTYCLDFSSLLSRCRNTTIRELTLSRPIMSIIPVASDGNKSTNSGETNVVFLEALRLETVESDNTEARLIRDSLFRQGISLERLMRLSRIAWSYNGGVFMKELWDILEGCSETLETLEIQIVLATNELDSLDWTKFTLPSLRILHLHLYSDEPPSGLAPHLPSFITYLINLCFPSSPNPNTRSSSQLEEIILTDHNTSWANDIDVGSLVLQILSDRKRFPRFEKFSWDALPTTVDYYSQNRVFENMKRAVAFEVEIDQKQTSW